MSDADDGRRAYLAFPISADLRLRLLDVVRAVREAEEPTQIVPEMVEVVVELTHTGLGHYFLEPLEVAGVGRLSQATAKVGIDSAARGIPLIVRRVLGSASDEQLLGLVDFMEGLLVETSE